MAEYRRVYHPTLNAFQDVPKGDSDKWKSGGWRLTNPGHVDESQAHPVGAHPGFAQIPVLEDTSRTTTTTAGAATTTATTSGSGTSGT